MNEKKTGGQKAFAVVVYILAVVGLAALIVGGVFGFKTLFSKIGGSEEIKTVELAEASAATPEAESDIQIVQLEGKTENEGSADTSKPAISEKLEKQEKEIEVALSDVAIPEAAVNKATMTDAVEEAKPEKVKNEKLTISFFGDSVLDNFRDETGICEIVARDMDATVYNCSVGGICASVYYQDNACTGEIDQMCGLGVVGAVRGFEDINKVLHGDFVTRGIINEHMEDIRKSDIFVVEYGMNDFLVGRFMSDEDNRNNPVTFEGAIRQIVGYLKAINEDAKIVLCEPNFVEFYRQSDGQYLGNTYNFNNGAGTQRDYCDKIKVLSEPDYLNTYLFPQSLQGIDEYNVNDMLLDGIHPNEAGRALYAKNLIQYLNEKVVPEIK